MCHLRERTSYLFDVTNSVLFYRLKFAVHRVMAVYNFKQEIRSMARCVLFEKFSGASSVFFYLYAHSFIRKNNVDVKERPIVPIPSVQENIYIYILVGKFNVQLAISLFRFRLRIKLPI